jgi:hypothetical protein
MDGENDAKDNKNRETEEGDDEDKNTMEESDPTEEPEEDAAQPVIELPMVIALPSSLEGNLDATGESSNEDQDEQVATRMEGQERSVKDTKEGSEELENQNVKSMTCKARTLFSDIHHGICRRRIEISKEEKLEERPGFLKALWNAWTAKEEDESTAEKMKDNDIAMMKSILSKATEEHQKRIQDLELQILKMENHLLSKSIDKQERASHYSLLENQLLKLENDILRFNQTFTEMRSETLKLQNQQQSQANDLAIVKKKTVSPDTSLLLLNETYVFETMKKHEEEIKALAKQFEDQASSLLQLEKKSDVLTKENENLAEKISAQSKLVEEIMAKLVDLSRTQQKPLNESTETKDSGRQVEEKLEEKEENAASRTQDENEKKEDNKNTDSDSKENNSNTKEAADDKKTPDEIKDQMTSEKEQEKTEKAMEKNQGDEKTGKVKTADDKMDKGKKSQKPPPPKPTFVVPKRPRYKHVHPIFVKGE